MSTLAMLRNSVTAALPQPLPGHDEGPDFPVFSRRVGAFDLAVTVGFEPTVGGYPTQLFESCTFGRSDTSPPKSLRDSGGARESRWG